MKRLLALLLVFCSAAQAQQIDYTYTQSYVGAPAPFQQLNQNQGTPLNLADDQVSNPINLGFNFTFYGQNFNSAYISSNGVLGFQGPINGCCSGYNLADSGNRYGIFAIQTDLINIQTSNPWYKIQGDEGNKTFTVGWYDMPIFYNGNARSSFEITLFESNNNILLNYGNLNTAGRFFTAGLKGNDGEYELLYSGTNDAFLENSSYMFSAPPPIPEFLYWVNLTSENGQFTLTTTGVVRYGASGIYAYAELQPGTYSCSNGFFGDPIPGVFKSCEFGSNDPPPVAAVDCAVDPYDETCVIDSVTSDETYFASEETGSDDGSDDGSDYFEQSADEEEQELLADEESFSEELFDEITDSPADNEETDLEEMLADEETIEEDVEEAPAVANRDLSDDEKAANLADAISKNTLEGALSIASAAESSAISQGTVSESTTSSGTSTKNASAITVADITSETTLSSLSASADMYVDASKEESSSSDSNSAGADILETGRQLGQAALATTLAATAESAAESVNQAENIAATSSNESQTVVASTVDQTQSQTEQLSEQVEDMSGLTVVDDKASETLVAEVTQQNNNEELTNTEVLNVQQTEETVAAEVQTTTVVINDEPEVVVAENNQTQESAVEYNDVESAMEVFAANLPQQITAAAEQEELENTILQQSIASSQTQQEETNTFSEAEAVTIANDPALANAFNVAPNMANLEVTGVLSQKQEEKSDAELRAEQVVAANKEEQDKINSNYMEADQSGIVAAMGADTDVGAYRTAMIRDNNNWYKPEDIYKNIVIKDNVRGSYFLEKGNTDTYKKMVEEQYK